MTSTQELVPVAPASAPQVTDPVSRPVPVPQGALPVTGFSNLAAAIASIQTEIADEDNRVVKHGKNAFHNYRYATMQDILQKLSPLMAKHGLVVMQSEVSRAMFDDDAAISITYEFTIIHKSGEVWPQKQTQTGLCQCRNSKGGFDDKSINKCHTQARKYFLLALFQIPTEDEVDADRGDNDGYRKERTKTDTKKREEAPPPKQEPPKKVPPFLIPPAEKIIDWAMQYVEQINLCLDAKEVAEWGRINQPTLAMIAEKAPKIADRIGVVQTSRLAELAERAGK